MIFKYFLLGTLSGFFSSTPLGPINLWVADHKLSKSPTKSQLFYFLSAVILVDIFFAGSALWGHFDFLEEAAEIRWTGIISGSFTVILGIILLLKSTSTIPVESKARHFDKWKSFAQGFILTAANPAFIVFWLFVANQIMTNLDKSLSTFELCSFILGVLAGDIIWFSFFSWILSHLEKKSQEATLKKIRMTVGFVFIALGVMGLGTYVFK